MLEFISLIMGVFLIKHLFTSFRLTEVQGTFLLEVAPLSKYSFAHILKKRSTSVVVEQPDSHQSSLGIDPMFARYTVGEKVKRCTSPKACFTSIEDLSEGSALVKKVETVRGKIRAAKVLEILGVTQGQKKSAFKEIRLLAFLNHPNILKLIEGYQSLDELWIVTKLAKFGTLANLVTTFPYLSAELKIGLLRQALSGLVYLHERNIAHRDIKPDNILIGKRGSLIADFGFATSPRMGPKSHKKAFGSPLYMAPEVLDIYCDKSAVEDDKTPKDYSTTSDIWSFGLTICECFIGLPFKSITNLNKLCDAQKDLLKSNAFVENLNSLGDDIAVAISKCLEVNGKLRISGKKLLELPLFKNAISDEQVEEMLRNLESRHCPSTQCND